MVKKVGKCITGDMCRVDSYTQDWFPVKMHPSTYYRRMDEIGETLQKSKGLYTELDLGQFVLLRFSEKDDLTSFYKKHHDHV